MQPWGGQQRVQGYQQLLRRLRGWSLVGHCLRGVRGVWVGRPFLSSFVDTCATHEAKQKTKNTKNKKQKTSRQVAHSENRNLLSLHSHARRVGRYSTTLRGTSDSVCVACEAGTANPHEGQSQAGACVACKQGQWVEAGRDLCSDCGSGRCLLPRPFHNSVIPALFSQICIYF